MTKIKERPIIFSAPMVRAILDGRKTMTRRIIDCNCNATHLDRLLGDWGLSLPPHRWDGDSNNIGWRWRGDREPQVGDWVEAWQTDVDDHASGPVKCKYGVPGDRLWVRETWADVNTENGPAIMYRSGGLHFCVDDAYPVEYERYPGMKFSMWCGDLARGEDGHSWHPSIFMPRWASRITLEITNLSVERIQDISEDDARAEGVMEWLTSFDGRAYDNIEQQWCRRQKTIYPSSSVTTPLPLYSILWDKINGPGSWDRNDWVWVISFRRIYA